MSRIRAWITRPGLHAGQRLAWVGGDYPGVVIDLRPLVVVVVGRVCRSRRCGCCWRSCGVSPIRPDEIIGDVPVVAVDPDALRGYRRRWVLGLDAAAATPEEFVAHVDDVLADWENGPDAAVWAADGSHQGPEPGWLSLDAVLAAQDEPPLRRAYLNWRASEGE